VSPSAAASPGPVEHESACRLKLTMPYSTHNGSLAIENRTPRPSPTAHRDRPWLRRLRERLESLYEVSETRGRVVPLEGARGLAVLLVFFVHFHTLFSGYLDSHSLSYVASILLGTVGNAGVDLFFALSGYLLYGATIRKPLNYKAFIRRRAGRIYPTFLFVFCLYLVLSWVFPERSRIPAALGAAFSYLTENLLFLPGIFDIEPMITVCWSLSYEFAFYLIMPLLVTATGMRSWTSQRRMVFFVCLALLGLGLRCAIPVIGQRVRLLYFVSGIMVYEFTQVNSLRKYLNYWSELAVLILTVACGGILFCLTTDYRPLHIPLQDGLSVTCVTVTLFVTLLAGTYYCLSFDGIISRMLSWTPARWLGNMSYSYYLIHGLQLQVLVWAFNRWYPPSGHSPVIFWSALPVAFAGTLLSATLLFVYVERPLSLSGGGAVGPTSAPGPKLLAGRAGQAVGADPSLRQRNWE
jgi:exopolysaccharide production protein ExoZ